MKLYWRLKSIPELAPLPEEDRNRVWTQAYHQLRKTRRWRISLFGTIFGAPMVAGAVFAVLGSDFAATGIVGVAVCAFVQFERYFARTFIRNIQASHSPEMQQHK